MTHLDSILNHPQTIEISMFFNCYTLFIKYHCIIVIIHRFSFHNLEAINGWGHVFKMRFLDFPKKSLSTPSSAIHNTTLNPTHNPTHYSTLLYTLLPAQLCAQLCLLFSLTSAYPFYTHSTRIITYNSIIFTLSLH